MHGISVVWFWLSCLSKHTENRLQFNLSQSMGHCMLSPPTCAATSFNPNLYVLQASCLSVKASVFRICFYVSVGSLSTSLGICQGVNWHICQNICQGICWVSYMWQLLECLSRHALALLLMHLSGYLSRHLSGVSVDPSFGTSIDLKCILSRGILSS